MKTLGERIKYARKLQNLSQEKLADLVKVGGKSTVSSWELNKRTPELSVLSKLATIYNCSLDWLIDGKAPPFEMKKVNTQIISEEIRDNMDSALPYLDMLSNKKLIISSSSPRQNSYKIPFHKFHTTTNEIEIEIDRDNQFIEVQGISGFEQAERAFSVIGTSMEPSITQGNILCVKELKKLDFFDPDSAYLIMADNQIMLKHIRTDLKDNSTLIFSSPNHPDFKISKKLIRAIYKVIISIRMW